MQMAQKETQGRQRMNKYVCDLCGKEGDRNGVFLPHGWQRVELFSLGSIYDLIFDTHKTLCPDCDFKREITVFKKKNPED